MPIPELRSLFNIRYPAEDMSHQQHSGEHVKSDAISMKRQTLQDRVFKPRNTNNSCIQTSDRYVSLLWKYMNFGLQCCSSEYGRRDIASGIERNTKNSNAPPYGRRGVGSQQNSIVPNSSIYFTNI